MRHPIQSSLLLCAGCVALLACSDDNNDDFEAQATLDVKQYVNGQLEKLSKAAADLQSAAPAADDNGWNVNDDKAAVDKMRAAWADARNAYERIEGSIAVLFDGLDVSTDARYDDFLAEEGPDDNLFDGEGVIGVHGIERILWADKHPARVVKFEMSLEGYKAAAFPATKEEADAFKNELCQKLVDDTVSMRKQFASLALAPNTAFWGMIGSMREQSEKTTKAASGEDESRYSQNTLDDMRANLAGARAVYEAFHPWIDSTTPAKTSKDIEAEFDEIDDAYSAIDGPALPAVPEKFNPDKPTADDLKSPYGKLWQLLNEKTDPENEDSLISKMATAANDMGIEGLEAE
jgi:iron uptake system component EfeO